MNFDPTPAQREFMDQIRTVLADEVAPYAESWDRESRFPEAAVKALGKAGASGVYIPSELGGRGLDTMAYALAIEEISSVLPALGITLSVNNSLYSNPIRRFGTPDQHKAFLEPVASGRAIGAFALTEAEAGSDATRLKTLAVRENGGYSLSGEKVMVTSGGPADFFLVIAATEPEKTSRGLTAFLIPADTPGVSRGPRDETMGLRSSDVRSLRFENVKLDEGNRLGDENRGMAILLESINTGRIGVGAQAVGIARAAYELALDHARQRKQFGKLLCEIPAVIEMLANMATEIEAARLTVYQAAQVRAFFADAARAKLAASEMCGRVTSMAIQVHGGWGYLTATGVERFHRDAKVTELYEGTSEIQRLILAGSLTHG
jgi:butyryl-CoA dehydrogenase